LPNCIEFLLTDIRWFAGFCLFDDPQYIIENLRLSQTLDSIEAGIHLGNCVLTRYR